MADSRNPSIRGTGLTVRGLTLCQRAQNGRRSQPEAFLEGIRSTDLRDVKAPLGIKVTFLKRRSPELKRLGEWLIELAQLLEQEE